MSTRNKGAGVAEERVERADQAAKPKAGEIGQQDSQDGEGGLPRPGGASFAQQ